MYLSVHKVSKFRHDILASEPYRNALSDVAEAVLLGPAKPPLTIQMSQPIFQAQPITKDTKSSAIHSLNTSTECITTGSY